MSNFTEGTLVQILHIAKPNFLATHPDVQAPERVSLGSIKTHTVGILLEMSYSKYWDVAVARVFTRYGVGWLSLDYCEEL